jgi:Trk-type K+ transport system membrane component
MTMTKYKKSTEKLNIVDRIYNSRSVDFWLITANLVVVTNWFLHPESLGAVGLMVAGLGLAIVTIIATNRRAQQILKEFSRDRQRTGLLTLVLSLVVAITIFNYATDPSQALVLNNDGIDKLKTIVGNSTASNGIIDNFISILRALFFIGFLIALYSAYETYIDRKELGDIVKAPLVLLLVIGLIDGAAKVFFA